MHRRPRVIAALTTACLALVAPGSAAWADHTNPNTLLSPVIPQPGSPALTGGEGKWEFIENLGPMQGTDLEFFTKKGIQYVSAGTLGQAPSGTPAFVGQRIVQLTDAAGKIDPKVVADHGSSRCQANSSATGLQHDVQAVPLVETELLLDTTDATGRCHDTPGGGTEIIDVSDLGKEGFEPREIGLLRFNGLSHTVTADPIRPGIFYNNQANFAAITWVDIVDVRSCMGLAGKTLEQKRAACKPVVYRLDYADEVSSKMLPDGKLAEPATCHDITASPNRLNCAGLNASFIIDVKDVFDATGTPRGKPLPCKVVDATASAAKVTDCALRPEGITSANPGTPDSLQGYEDAGKPAVLGARIITTVNHPGRACPSPTTTDCNTNLVVRSDQGVAVSHENDPALGGKYMLVTDERGGGVVPPGATCAPGLDNPVGNGGLHVFDVSNPAKPVYAETPSGEKAIYIGTSPTPSPTFCTIHVIEQIPGEARVIAAYYDGGTKIVDYTIDADGKWTFKETAAYRLPGANTWASEVFKVQKNADGSNTYFFVSTSFALGEGTARGIDVFSWTGPANLIANAVAQPAGAAPAPGNAPPPGSAPQAPSAPQPAGGGLPATGADTALAALALLLLPLAYAVRRMRGRTDPIG